MFPDRARLWLLLAITWLAVPIAHAARPLPFALNDPDGSWHIVAVDKPLTAEIAVDVGIRSPISKGRFVVLSSAAVSFDSAGLEAFAQQLKSALAPGQNPEVTTRPEKQMGFDGLMQTFELRDDTTLYACELFTFSHASRGWGLLYLIPKTGEAAPAAPFQILRPEASVPADVVALSPFRVKDDPVTGFPVSFNVESNPTTARITRIIVSEVPPDSVTEQAGVKVGDEVIAINGRKTQEFAIGMGKKSELGLIFLNRDPGDEVTLEVRTPGAAKSRKVIISVSRRSTGPTFWGRR